MVTMTRVYELFHEVQNELKDLVPYSKNISSSLGELKTKKTLGRCYSMYGMFRISLSKYLLECSEQLIKNVIAHEIIHTVPYCFNHGRNFQHYANLVNYKLGYKIEIRNTNTEFNPPHKYKLICKKCGKVYYRDRLNQKYVANNVYRCSVDSGELKIEKTA